MKYKVYLYDRIVSYELPSCIVEITEVEIVKETKHYVWITSDYRVRKSTLGDNYYDSWDEAKGALYNFQKRCVENLQKKVRESIRKLKEIEALKQKGE
jgi:hypothetical protein